jgi:hypothetical protein
VTRSTISILIAGLALAITLWREWRDRPRLEITTIWGVRSDGTAHAFITVFNLGRRPDTIRKIGFLWDTEPPVPPRAKGSLIVTEPWSHVMIDGGRHHQVELDLTELPVHADTPVRAFAETARGAYKWEEKAHAIFRDLLEMGWNPRPGSPSELLAPLPQVKAKPVEPPWKIWKRHSLRRPTLAAPADWSEVGADGRWTIS